MRVMRVKVTSNDDYPICYDDQRGLAIEDGEIIGASDDFAFQMGRVRKMFCAYWDMFAARSAAHRAAEPPHVSR